MTESRHFLTFSFLSLTAEKPLKDSGQSWVILGNLLLLEDLCKQSYLFWLWAFSRKKRLIKLLNNAPDDHCLIIHLQIFCSLIFENFNLAKASLGISDSLTMTRKLKKNKTLFTSSSGWHFDITLQMWLILSLLPSILEGTRSIFPPMPDTWIWCQLSETPKLWPPDSWVMSIKFCRSSSIICKQKLILSVRAGLPATKIST